MPESCLFRKLAMPQHKSKGQMKKEELGDYVAYKHITLRKSVKL